MAISAERFKYLDKETNVPVEEFNSITDNLIYNNAAELVDSAMEAAQDGQEMLDKVCGGMEELKDMVMEGAESIGESVKDALNSAIDAISNMPLSNMAKNIFNSIKQLDLKGVKDFLGDLLHVGASFLCNNLNFLKLFMLGYAINQNILVGLLTALLLSWLDRFCKSYASNDVFSSNRTEQMEMVVPPTGKTIDNSNVFTTFTNTYSDYLKATSPINLQTPMSSTDFLNGVTSGNISSSISNLRESEISYDQKQSYLTALNNNLSNYSAGSSEYNNILSAKGQLQNLPIVSNARRENSINYSNLSDQLGNLAKSVTNIDTSTINKFSLTNIEQGLLSKLDSFKTASMNSSDIQTRNLNTGNFDTYDFNNILPPLTAEETTYLTSLDGTGTAHRVHDLHPTSAVFLEA